MKNKFSGSSFDSFLEDEGLEAEVAARIAKRTFVNDLKKKMARTKTTKSAFRRRLHSPTTTERLFSDNVGVSLETLAKAAAVVGCELEVKLVPRNRRTKRKVA